MSDHKFTNLPIYLGIIVFMALGILLLRLILIPALVKSQLAAGQNPPVLITANQDNYEIGRNLDFWIDPNQGTTIEEVIQHPEYFQRSTKQIINFSFSTNSVWGRFRVDNIDHPKSDWLLNLARTDTGRWEIYQQQDGKIMKRINGVQTPPHQREYPRTHLGFILHQPPGSSSTYYMRFLTDSITVINLSLRPLDDFEKSIYWEQLFLGVYYGFLLALIGYNVFLVASIREGSYVYHVIFVICVLIFSLCFDGLLANYPALSKRQDFFIFFIGCVGMFSMLRFSTSFLRTGVYLPSYHRLMVAIANTALGMAFLSLLIDYRLLRPLDAFLFSTTLIGFACGLLSWRRGYLPSRYYVLATCSFFINSLFINFIRIGLTPANAVVVLVGRGSVMVMVLLFSFALGDRINVLKQEKLAAQAMALQEQSISLQLKDDLAKALQLVNENLERRVNDRTIQLQQEVAERRKAEEAAQQANRAKSRFLANMSHELRTPLNAILGFSQLMKGDSNLSSEQNQNLETINRSGRHLLSLINQVLDLSKIEAGRMDIQVNVCNLFNLCQELITMFQLQTQKKSIYLQLNYSPNLPQFIKTDESKLRQVLINLFSNATKFTSEGGVTLSIEQDTNYLHFRVSDTGMGIAPEEIPLLFQAFQQTSSGERSNEGTGLGLHISREFVRLLGGDMTVTSEINRGTTFSFYIPLVLAQPPINHTPPSETNSGPQLLSAEELTVLPQDFLESFKYLVLQGDLGAMREATATIPAIVAQKLDQMIASFAFEKLLHLIDKALKIQNPAKSSPTNLEDCQD